MSGLAWFVILVSLGGIAFLTWRAVNNWQARKRSEEDRFVAFMGVAKQPKPVQTPVAVPASTLLQEKLLFESATKTAEAGEPDLAIQLYDRLLERFPHSGLAEQARAAIEKQKSRLAKG